ncbi:hypothetical protein SLS62_009832 [Diatrype stigma]|uniref:G-protein coupled receptors family 2 profile 2 domain-containing protein n=1 Tax=Diatrype stigma TaxID=117547 RepID=A0AAN9YHL6_9PEZI
MSSAEVEPDHFDIISTIERVGSSLSLLGCLFIIFTFSYSEAFRKPINRLVFYASFGNLMTVVGTLLARTHIAYGDSFGCQFQAFLIQMVAIVITFFIYIRAGGDIYKKRKQLRNFNSSHDRRATTIDNPFALKTTEVTVTSEVTKEPLPTERLSSRGVSAGLRAAEDLNAPYAVMISSDPTVRVKTEDAPRPVTRGGGDEQKVQKSKANLDINKAVWSYTKCSLLFFTALLVTWIPSSANRVYSVIYPAQISWPLEYLSAVVLPLQGFWNTVIYVSTSWSAVRLLFEGNRGRAITPGFITDFQRGRRSNRSRKYFGSESVTELADPRDTNSSWGGSIDAPRRGHQNV